MSNAVATRPTGTIVEIAARVEDHAVWLALALVVLGTVVRTVDAASCYLNPDESAHFDLANTSDWTGAWQSSLTIAHPPLLILLLHGLLRMGRSEFLLRLPSLAAGVATLWLIFVWLRPSLGPLPALLALWLMAVSPAAIAASTEVRQYGILVFFICGSLVAADRAFDKESTFWATLHGLLMLGAIFTHYAAVVAAAAAGLYVLVRLMLTKLPIRVRFAFVAGQIVWLASLAALYSFHLRPFVALATGRQPGYVTAYYYIKGSSSLIGYMAHALRMTFAYPLGSSRFSLLMMLVFAVGVAVLITGRSLLQKTQALLFAVPILFAMAATLARVLPMDGTRHEAYLLPFLAAGMAAATTRLQPRTAAAVLLGAVVLTPAFLLHHLPDNDPHKFPRRDMQEAMATLRRMAPPGSPLFVDYETREVLGYYLGRNQPDTRISHAGEEALLGGYRVAVPENFQWAFDAQNVRSDLQQWASSQHLATGTPVWIVSSSWFEAPLAVRTPPRADVAARVFGRISVMRMPVAIP